MDFLLLTLLVILQLTLNAYALTSHSRVAKLQLGLIVLNLSAGAFIGYFGASFVWGFTAQLFQLPKGTVFFSSPLTAGGAVALLSTSFFPLIYFRYVCIPLIRDASVNYGNAIRKSAVVKKQRSLENQP